MFNEFTLSSLSLEMKSEERNENCKISLKQKKKKKIFYSVIHRISTKKDKKKLKAFSNFIEILS